MTIQSLIRTLNKNRPSTVQEFKKLGIKLRFLSEGAFRQVYEIKGLPLVVKFPHDSSDDCIEHSVFEYKHINRILKFKKYKLLKKYMPKVYYFDKKSGIIVFRKYKYVYTKKLKDSTRIVELSDLVNKIMGYECDVNGGNVGIEKNTLKILDLGCFEEFAEWVGY